MCSIEVFWMRLTFLWTTTSECACNCTRYPYLQLCDLCPLLCSLQLTLKDHQFTGNLALKKKKKKKRHKITVEQKQKRLQSHVNTESQRKMFSVRAPPRICGPPPQRCVWPLWAASPGSPSSPRLSWPCSRSPSCLWRLNRQTGFSSTRQHKFGHQGYTLAFPYDCLWVLCGDMPMMGFCFCNSCRHAALHAN